MLERISEATDADASVDSLMRAVARLPSAPTGTGHDAQALHRRFGEQFRRATAGRFALTSLLGAGGMGIVYAARNERTGREVAIKFLLPHPEQRTRRARAARFVREARAAGCIRHINVVDVYDVESDADAPYLIMERLHGETLRARMQRGPLAVDEALAIVRAAIDGVAEAHRQGVIHRDLKPDNVFLACTADSAQPIPKVLDFGVSRILACAQATESTSTLTHAGDLLGTPAYMPLEQLRGEANVDARTDVYALGVILYEALSGARPYVAQSVGDLIARMATEPATPLRSLLPALSPTLERIVMQALAREPDKRQPDVASLGRALDEVRAEWRRPQGIALRALAFGGVATLASVLALHLGAAAGAHKEAERAREKPIAAQQASMLAAPAIRGLERPPPALPSALPVAAARATTTLVSAPQTGSAPQTVSAPQPDSVPAAADELAARERPPVRAASPRTSPRPRPQRAPASAERIDRATALHPKDF